MSSAPAAAPAAAPVAAPVAAPTVAEQVAALDLPAGTHFAEVGGPGGWTTSQMHAAIEQPGAAIPSRGVSGPVGSADSPTFWQRFSDTMARGAQDALGKARDAMPKTGDEWKDFLGGMVKDSDERGPGMESLMESILSQGGMRR
jgi:hypothetical protein